MEHSPRKKKRVHHTKGPPFPVPIASITTEPARSDRWFYYTGIFHGRGVTIHHSGDISFLYKMGFFGKGSLSRGMPDYSQLYKTVYLKHEDEAEQFKVMCKRKYKRRLKWQKMSTGQLISSDDDDDDDDGNNVTEELEECSRDLHENKNISSPINLKTNRQKFISETTENFEDELEKESSECKKSYMKSAEDLWEQSAGDADFWSTGFANNETLSSNMGVEHTSSQKHHENVKKTPSVTDSSIQSQENQSQEQTKTTASVCDRSMSWQNEPESEDSINSKPTNLVEHSSKLSSEYPVNVRGHHVDDCHDRSVAIIDVGFSGQSDDISGQIAPGQNRTDDTSDCHVLEDVDEFSDLHPLCTESDTHGDIFVIDDSDDEDNKIKRKRWVSVIKLEPFHVKETLELSLEEAFFLSYGLGCLNVLTSDNEPMSLSCMWKTFSKQKHFLPKYIAYHYYRSKGWVPKSGLKFGTDYIVYKEGPAFYHGSFSVVVRMVDLKTLSEDSNRILSWRTLSGLNRITEHVAKNLLVCYVIAPDLPSDELLSPTCIPKFKIQEMEISRWISAQEREENKTKECIP